MSDDEQDEKDEKPDTSQQDGKSDQDEKSDEDTSDSGGTIRDVNEKPPDEEIEEIEKEREERLDPDNRPDNVEIDNTPRDFDAETGKFTDSDDYDESEKQFDPKAT